MKIDDFTRLNPNSNITIGIRKRTSPKTNGEELPTVKNQNWNGEFIWHESYPENMNDLIREWYEIPYIKNIVK